MKGGKCPYAIVSISACSTIVICSGTSKPADLCNSMRLLSPLSQSSSRELPGIGFKRKARASYNDVLL